MSKDGVTLKEGNLRDGKLYCRGKMFYSHGPGYILEANWHYDTLEEGPFKIERVGKSPFRKIRKGKFVIKGKYVYTNEYGEESDDICSDIIVTRWKK